MDISQLKDQLQIINDWIKHADNKIGIISAFYVGILGFWISNIHILKISLGCLYYFGLSLMLLIFITGFILLYLSLTPRLKNIHRDSIFYFGTIANKSLSSFRNQILDLTDDEVKRGLIEQIHTNSEVADQKMYYIKYSIYPLLVLLLLNIIVTFFI